MHRNRWRAPLLAAPVLATAAAGLTACGASPASRVNSISSTASAGTAGQAGPITPAKLVGALLTRINGAPATTRAAGGRYDSLPQVKSVEQQAKGPVSCAHPALTGVQPGTLGSAPAAAVSFKVGRNGVSEILAAPSPTTADSVLRRALSASCEHYQASAGGKEIQYTAAEQSVTGIGEQARVLNVQAAGQPDSDIWSVVFRGAGFIGSVTVVGPNASELAVRELGLQAYGFAAKSLS